MTSTNHSLIKVLQVNQATKTIHFCDSHCKLSLDTYGPQTLRSPEEPHHHDVLRIAASLRGKEGHLRQLFRFFSHQPWGCSLQQSHNDPDIGQADYDLRAPFSYLRSLPSAGNLWLVRWKKHIRFQLFGDFFL